jgi:hypothetical protein
MLFNHASLCSSSGYRLQSTRQNEATLDFLPLPAPSLNRPPTNPPTPSNPLLPCPLPLPRRTYHILSYPILSYPILSYPASKLLFSSFSSFLSFYTSIKTQLHAVKQRVHIYSFSTPPPSCPTLALCLLRIYKQN